MYRLEIRKGWEVIKEYKDDHSYDAVLEKARDDGWVDWYFGDDYVIREDAWMYDHVDKIIVLEGDPNIFEEVVLEITKREHLDDEEEAE